MLVVDWLIEPARHRLPRRLAIALLGYPVAWLTYTLVRGAAEGWYPYPFVDVGSHGYGRVLLDSLILGICFLAGALAFVLIGNWRSRAPPALRTYEAKHV